MLKQAGEALVSHQFTMLKHDETAEKGTRLDCGDCNGPPEPYFGGKNWLRTSSLLDVAYSCV
jgi:hypothetical protein